MKRVLTDEWGTVALAMAGIVILVLALAAFAIQQGEPVFHFPNREGQVDAACVMGLAEPGHDCSNAGVHGQ